LGLTEGRAGDDPWRRYSYTTVTILSEIPC
jgi:hypothetical protein